VVCIFQLPAMKGFRAIMSFTSFEYLLASCLNIQRAAGNIIKMGDVFKVKRSILISLYF
jgi:hypothetical protein